MGFREVKIEELSFNPFEKIGKQWMLITAGDENMSNTMTASWGGLGIMWGKKAATVYIRPQRYTIEFVDQEERFTLSFLPEEYRKAMNFCGSVSGREVDDKWKSAGLTPYAVDETIGVEEAEMILVCRKMYTQEMLPECFLETENIDKWYPDGDYHIMYIAEIEKVLIRE